MATRLVLPFYNADKNDDNANDNAKDNDNDSNDSNDNDNDNDFSQMATRPVLPTARD